MKLFDSPTLLVEFVEIDGLPIFRYTWRTLEKKRLKERSEQFKVSVGYCFLYAEQKRIIKLLFLVVNPTYDGKKHEIDVRELDMLAETYFPHHDFCVAVLVPKIDLKIKVFVEKMYKGLESNIFDDLKDAIKFLKKNAFIEIQTENTEKKILIELLEQSNGLILCLEKMQEFDPEKEIEYSLHISRLNDVENLFNSRLIEFEDIEKVKAQLRNTILKIIKEWES